MRTQMCGRSSRAAVLRVLYSTTTGQQAQSSSTELTPAFLVTFDATACTRVRLSRQRLGEARQLLASAETITDLAQLVRLVESANDLAHALPVDETERKSLLEDVTAARQAVASRADVQLDKAVVQAENTLRSGEIEQNTNTLVNALSLVGMSADGISAWNRIYQNLVAHLSAKGIAGQRRAVAAGWCVFRIRSKASLRIGSDAISKPKAILLIKKDAALDVAPLLRDPLNPILRDMGQRQ